MNMNIDLFAHNTFGKVALKKINHASENFRLYEVGYVEAKASEHRTLLVKGAVFRKAKSGPNKGKLSIKVNGTERSVTVTPEECMEYENEKQNQNGK